MNTSSREAILEAAKLAAQAHGYNGLNFRDLAQDVGIKAASIYYHFPSKADLGAAVARRYWEESARALEAIVAETPDPIRCLRRYPATFRTALTSGNRMCLCSYMAAEYDDLPAAVKHEVQSFTDINIAWLGQRLTDAALVDAAHSTDRGRAIFAAIAGAQLIARSRADIALYDNMINAYRAAGLLPA